MSETYDLNICTDCLMMLANGDVGDRGDIGELTEYQQDAGAWIGELGAELEAVQS